MLVNTAALNFNPVLRGAYEELQPLEQDLVAIHEALLAADHIAIIFPLWLGSMPAILKGFLERILQPDIFPAAREGKFAKPLAGKTARVIVTMGMPSFVYRWWFGTHALKVLEHNILRFVGAGPVRTTIHGSIEAVGDEKRRAWLQNAEAIGRQAA